jgi:hypothetical protein
MTSNDDKADGQPSTIAAEGWARIGANAFQIELQGLSEDQTPR